MALIPFSMQLRAKSLRQTLNSATSPLSYVLRDKIGRIDTLEGVAGNRWLGAVTHTQDASQGSTFYAPIGMLNIQWYREALASPYTQTKINGQTGASYVSTAADGPDAATPDEPRFRLVARGNIGGVLIDAVCYRPVLGTPILLDDFETGTLVVNGVNGDNKGTSSTGDDVGALDPVRKGSGYASALMQAGTNAFSAARLERTFASPPATPAALGVVSYWFRNGGGYFTNNSAVQFGNTGTLATGITTALGSLSPAGVYHRSFHASEDATLTELPGPITKHRSTAAPRWHHADCAMDRLVARSKGRAQIVIGWDDGYASQYNTGFPIMKALNLPFTVYFPSTMGAMNVAQLKEMEASGLADIAGDGSPDDASLLNQATVALALERAKANRQWLIDNGFTRAKDYICYPNGDFSANSYKAALPFTDTARQYTSGQVTAATYAEGSATITSLASVADLAVGYRVFGAGLPGEGAEILSIDSGASSIVVDTKAIRSGTWGLNFYYTQSPFDGLALPAALEAAGFRRARTTMADLWDLRFGYDSRRLWSPAFSSSGLNFATFKANVDLAVLRGASIEYYFHGIGADGLQISAALYQQCMEYVASLRDQGLIDVLTVSQHDAANRYATHPFATDETTYTVAPYVDYLTAAVPASTRRAFSPMASYMHCADNGYAIQAGADGKSFRYETRGDGTSWGPDGAIQQRAEEASFRMQASGDGNLNPLPDALMWATGRFPGPHMWMSYQFEWDGVGVNLADLGYLIVGQIHSNGSPDPSGPIFHWNIRPDGLLEAGNNAGVSGRLTPVRVGGRYNLVCYVRQGKSSDGIIRAWVNGRKVLDASGLNVGYVQSNGDLNVPLFKRGLYTYPRRADGADKRLIARNFNPEISVTERGLIARTIKPAPMTPVPAAPTVWAVPGSGQNVIHLRDSHAGGASISSRKLQRTTTPDISTSWTTIATDPTFPYTDGSLTASTKYYYRAISTNSYGDSAPSGEADGTPT